jgi:hypothetical protein
MTCNCIQCTAFPDDASPLTHDLHSPSVHALVDAVARTHQVSFAQAVRWMLEADWSVVAGEVEG